MAKIATTRPLRRTITSAARRFGSVRALALLVLVFPAAAQAHTGTASVSCEGAQFNFTAFAAGSNTVHYRVKVDGVTAREGTFVLTDSRGQSGTLTVPMTINDTHTVEAYAWWVASETQDRHQRPESSPALASKVVKCAPTPPSPPVTPPVTPPSTPPATPPSTPPSTPPAAATPPPVQAVAGTRRASGTARLAVPRSCASRTARVTVSGRSLRRVTVSVNGRRVRTVNVRSGRRSVTVAVPMRRSGPSRQTVVARVTFRNGAPSRTLTARATRCAQTQVLPQFTG